MRKNIAPLLAIAFVVAIISTGLFYGMFASKLASASTDRVIPKRDAVESAGVPVGMRALTIHVSESSGVLALLKPGTRIDIQAVSDRNRPAVLRTILQNIEVLSSSVQPEA